MEFAVVWIACGVIGALLQRRWYRVKRIQQRTPVLDLALNVIYGPIGLVASAIAYTTY